MSDYGWPDVTYEAVNESLCYHSRKHLEACNNFDARNFDAIDRVVRALERMYSSTKVVGSGVPEDWAKFIRENVDWDATPGWPWRKNFPTNRDLFGFDGVTVLVERVEMVRVAVLDRLNALLDGPASDPIYLFIKREAHKKKKIDNKSWRLISGVGLTDCLVDRILYGDWLDRMVENWLEIPSKAGWAPQKGGFIWMAKAFGNNVPVSIDKSAWDWTVQEWHVDVMEKLVPRMIFGRDENWDAMFHNRMTALFRSGNPVFKMACGCEFTQKVDGIQKSGCLGTIGFNSIWQVAIHLAAGGGEHDLIFSLGDDTVQEEPNEAYYENLVGLGALVKEVDKGWPIKFGGHVITNGLCVPSYRGKHMFALKYLEPDVGFETLESYRHLYAMDDDVLPLLDDIVLSIFGPKDVMSDEYLKEWYLSFDD